MSLPLLLLSAASMVFAVASLIQSRKFVHMSQAFEALKTEVASSKSVMARAAETLNQLIAKIPNPENVVDPTEVAAVTADLHQASASLDAALTAATPSTTPTV